MKSRFLNCLFLLLCFWLYHHNISVSALDISTPEEMNLDRNKLKNIDIQIARLVDQGKLPGASYLVLRGGKAVYSRSIGYINQFTRQPYAVNSICRLMSMSKPIAAVGIMKLVEEGKISLEDPVYKYIPQFQNMRVYVRGEGQSMVTEPLQRDPTIKDLLLHTSGLSYGQGDTGAPHPVDSMFNTFQIPFMSLEAFINEVTSIPLLMQPGKKWHYSFSYDVIGYIIQKVSGQPVDQWFAQNVFTPLGMMDTGFYVPAEKVSRYATAYMEGQPGVLTPISAPLTSFGDLQSYNSPAFISLGAGILSTALDYAKFAQCLLDGGILDGVQILQSKTIDVMWRNQLPLDLLPISLQGWTSNEETGFGLGFTVSTAEKVTEMDGKWDLYSGSNRIGNIAWGGGQMTNWIASKDGDFVITFMTQRIGDIGTFHQLLVEGVWGAVTGYSPRQLEAMRQKQNEQAVTTATTGNRRIENYDNKNYNNNLRFRRQSVKQTTAILNNNNIDMAGMTLTEDIPIGVINPSVEIGVAFTPETEKSSSEIVNTENMERLKPTPTGIDPNMNKMGLDVIDFVNPASLFQVDESISPMIMIPEYPDTERHFEIERHFEMIDDISLINGEELATAKAEELEEILSNENNNVDSNLMQIKYQNNNSKYPRKLKQKVSNTEEERPEIESMSYKGKGKPKKSKHGKPKRKGVDPRVAAHLAEKEERKRAIYAEHGIPYPTSPKHHKNPITSSSSPLSPISPISSSPGSSLPGSVSSSATIPGSSLPGPSSGLSASSAAAAAAAAAAVASSSSSPVSPISPALGGSASSNLPPGAAAASINAAVPAVADLILDNGVLGGSSSSPGSTAPLDAIVPIAASSSLPGSTAIPSSENSPIPIPSSADLGSSLPAIISASSGTSNNDNISWEDLIRNGNRQLQSSDLGVVPPIAKKVVSNKIKKKSKKAAKQVEKDVVKSLKQTEKERRKEYKKLKKSKDDKDAIKTLREEEKGNRKHYKDTKKNIRKNGVTGNPSGAAITPIAGSNAIPGANVIPPSTSSPNIPVTSIDDIASSTASIIPIIAPILAEEGSSYGSSGMPSSLDLQTIAALAGAQGGGSRPAIGNEQSWEEIVSGQNNLNFRHLESGSVEEDVTATPTLAKEEEQAVSEKKESDIVTMRNQDREKAKPRRIRNNNPGEGREGPIKKMKSAFTGAMSWFQ